MPWSTCPDDVLLSIGSHIYSNLRPIAYSVDFENRRQSFRQLVLVCRRFNAVFIMLLYRTLCLTYERNTWPSEYENLWLDQNPLRPIMASLLRTLSQNPTLGHYTHFLELLWERYDDNTEDHERLSGYISMFPSLRELEVSPPARPYLDGSNKIFEFLQQNPMESLRMLRMTQPVAPSMLPYLFFLPSIQRIDLLLLARPEESWPLPQGHIPGHSRITHLLLAAALTPCQLTEVLSWPAALQSLVYSHQGHQSCDTQVLTPGTFTSALKGFTRSLKTLKINISSLPFISVDTCESSEGNFNLSFPPYLDARSFQVLQELSVPSHFLFVGLPNQKYDLKTLKNQHIPLSLQSLDIVFGRGDRSLLMDRHWINMQKTAAVAWLFVLVELRCKRGWYLNLQRIVLVGEQFTQVYCTTPDSGRLEPHFARQRVQLNFQITPVYITTPQDAYGTHDSEEETWGYGEFWECDYEFRENGAPMFGENQTEYSNSPRGSWCSDEDEHWREKELLEDQGWERWDEEMEAERALAGQRWERGQWPPYEETREEREDIYRYSGRMYW